MEMLKSMLEQEFKDSVVLVSKSNFDSNIIYIGLLDKKGLDFYCRYTIVNNKVFVIHGDTNVYEIEKINEVLKHL